MMTTTFLRPLGTALLGLGLATQAVAIDVTGAGATFPAPIYAKWAESYKSAHGSTINYQAIGSGGGLKQIKAKTVDFGASDDPVPGEELAKDGLVQFPAVIGGIVPIINVQGIGPGGITLDAATVAAIYAGTITEWNDEAIAKLNPGVKLPEQAISPIYRSDSSGTTAAFTHYLAAVVPSFKDEVGAGKTVDWPVGMGGKGNAGVAANVGKVAGSIGYVEYAYAKQNKLAHARFVNKAGKTVEPDYKSFAAAARGADWNSAPGMGVALHNQPDPEAWPMTSASFILMQKSDLGKTEKSAEVLKFFRWALKEGGQQAIDMDYVPIPETVVPLIEKNLQAAGAPAP